MIFPDKNPARDELWKALEPTRKALWESVNPGLPWDITMEEAERVGLVNGRVQLHPEDVVRRAEPSLRPSSEAETSAPSAQSRRAAA